MKWFLKKLKGGCKHPKKTRVWIKQKVQTFESDQPGPLHLELHSRMSVCGSCGEELGLFVKFYVVGGDGHRLLVPIYDI